MDVRCWGSGGRPATKTICNIILSTPWRVAPDAPFEKRIPEIPVIYPRVSLKPLRQVPGAGWLH